MAVNVLPPLLLTSHCTVGRVGRGRGGESDAAARGHGLAAGSVVIDGPKSTVSVAAVVVALASCW